jgi:hypothetical protein
MGRLGIACFSGPNLSEIVDNVKLAESLGSDAACVAKYRKGLRFPKRYETRLNASSLFPLTVPARQMTSIFSDTVSR